jgi:hypothetical protein
MEKELAALMKSTLCIKQAPVPEGVDPKSILCAYFKAGVCEKGAKCKFGHDLTLARKSAKASVYEEKAAKKEEDLMADWDQAKLEEVVKTKASQKATTDIVCQFFLDAIEKEQYGWFWLCPNGGDACKYRHSLPPGFVYKSKKERDAEAAAKAALDTDVDITEVIEAARAALPSGGTPVTAESFAKWKAARDARRAAEAHALAEDVMKRRAGGAAGDAAAAPGGKDRMLSGRALFTYDPSLFVDDAAAADKFDDLEEGDEEEAGAAAAAGGGAAADGSDADGDGEGEGEEEEDEDEEEGDEEEDEEDDAAAVAVGGGAAAAAAAAGAGDDA